MIRLTRAQVREVDRRAIEQYGIPGIVLMENASRGAADVAWSMVKGAAGAQVLILCGGGNNGGDGLAVARHLHNRGLSVRVALTIDPAKYQGDALINWRIVQAMNLLATAADPDAIAGADVSLIIDAIFGTGLSEPPRPPFDKIAAAIERNGRPVLAIDLPSGLDCDRGEPLRACIRASRTVTFVAEKAGFANPASRQYTGEVSVADIGCPPGIINEVLARF